ncbi:MULTISPECIES: hypothetical protein [unclassified Flavobacterium]|uniref:hypothetical protein n=1 Tax=unclassified Flavobacterium TaxID=196869 RepID=UPI00360A2EF1
MKIYTSLLLLLLSYSAKADTITTWNVYYNHKLIKQFKANPEVKEIQIKASDYSSGDYLAIQYGDDMPCHTCSYELTVVAEGKDPIFTLTTKDKYKFMTIDLKAILSKFKSKNGNRFFVVYFTEIDEKGKRNSGSRLFNIKIS